MSQTSLHWLATAAIVLALFAPLGLLKLSFIIRAAWRLSLLAVATYAIMRLVGSPLRPQFDSQSAGRELWEQLILAGWFVLTARTAVSVARMIVALRTKSKEAQIVVDLIAGAIYLAAAVSVVTFVFEFPLGGLLATSGILAIVLGLALQSTLSDLFSGIAVGIERPFRAGELVWIEGGVEGTITQINWRSTHIATGPDHITVIPNSVIAKARVINHSRPTTLRMDKVEVRLDPAAPSSHCVATLTAAVKACRLLLETPAPLVVQKALEGDGALYEIWFAVEDSDALPSAKTELFGEIQRHLRHAGIAIGVKGIATVAKVEKPTIGDLLAESDLFGSVTNEGRQTLTGHLSEVHLKPGEHLITQNQAADALYLIASGTVKILRNNGHADRIVHRMGPGGTLGAIGLITGANYAASAIALTPVRAFRLDKAGIMAAVAGRAELAGELEMMAHRGQAALADVTAQDHNQHEQPEVLILKIRHFLERLRDGDPF